MRNSKFWLMLFVGALALVVLIGIVGNAQPSAAAPVPAPTPVSVSRTGAAPLDVTFFEAEAVTADTTSTCVALANYERADVYYSITVEAGNINTSTVYLQHGNSPAALVDGIAVGSAVSTDTTYLNQYQLFGRYTCLKVDTTDASTGTVTITANALAK